MKIDSPAAVQARIDTIREVRHDDEAAHTLEDALWYDVLLAIAAGECSDPTECARMALTTREIDFARWCA
jgi:hypothetical protein